MPTIKVKVEGKIATNLTPQEKIVWDNEDYEVEFEFDETWAKANLKTGLFIANGELIPQPFSGNICPMPIIGNTTLLAIGVKTDDGRLYTTTPAYADCLKSASGLAKNKIPAPTKDVYDQIIELINKYVEGGSLTREELKQVIADETADIRDKANQIEEIANNAVSTAESAQQSASEALSVANNADRKATEALSTAQQGVEKIDTALETATNASAKSDIAILTANDALSVANEAKNTADNIDEIANQALSLVESADTKIQANVTAIATNKTSIEVLSATTNEKFSAITQRVSKNESNISALSGSKQDKLEIDGNYDAQKNPVATVNTVGAKIADLVAGAPASLDTLKEIADWINAHPASVPEINALITKNATDIATNTGNIALLNGEIIKLLDDKQAKNDSGLNTTSKQVVGAINELKDDVDETKGKLDTTNATAVSALTISNEAKDKAQSAIDSLPTIKQEAIDEANAYIDSEIEGVLSNAGEWDEETLANANNYTDESVEQAIELINTNSIADLQAQIDVHDRNIAGLEGEVERVEGIAKGANQSLVYTDYAEMVMYFYGLEAKAKNVGTNVLIKQLNVPDLWIYANDATAGGGSSNMTNEQVLAELKANGTVHIGRYIFAVLETQKVDLTDYATKEYVGTAKQEAISASQVKIVRLI